jgi:hypothetical protein
MRATARIATHDPVIDLTASNPGIGRETPKSGLRLATLRLAIE